MEEDFAVTSKIVGLNPQRMILITAIMVLIGFLYGLVQLYTSLTGEPAGVSFRLAGEVLQKQLRRSRGEQTSHGPPVTRKKKAAEKAAAALLKEPSEMPSVPSSTSDDPLSKKADLKQQATELKDRSDRASWTPENVVVVIIGHDCTNCLQRSLKSLLSQEGLSSVSVAVSLDAPQHVNAMNAVAQSFAHKIDVWTKPPQTGTPSVAVANIAEHFRFALQTSFVEKDFEFAIFVENDLELAPDFLHLFRSTSQLLLQDESLFCVSAWHDNGFKDRVTDERRLFRTDYFPGLGWMIQRKTWLSISSKWPRFPSTGWDHWLRHGSGLRPRECIVPEVPRTLHFGDSGANVKKGNAIAKLLERMAVSSLLPGNLGDLSYLRKQNYEAALESTLKDAIFVDSPGSFFKLVKGNAGSSGLCFKLAYTREDFKDTASKLGIYSGQPRASRRGVILTKIEGVNLALIDRRQGEGLLPKELLITRHPHLKAVRASPNTNCIVACSGERALCAEDQFEFINTCEALTATFPCEDGCGHQVGSEIPCYVHDSSRDTAHQCLVSDEDAPRCDASHPSTSRLCACVF